MFYVVYLNRCFTESTKKKKASKKPGGPTEMLSDWSMKTRIRMDYSQQKGWQKTRLNCVDKHRTCLMAAAEYFKKDRIHH